jgi:hypothetical protein
MANEKKKKKKKKKKKEPGDLMASSHERKRCLPLQSTVEMGEILCKKKRLEIRCWLPDAALLRLSFLSEQMWFMSKYSKLGRSHTH